MQQCPDTHSVPNDLYHTKLRNIQLKWFWMLLASPLLHFQNLFSKPLPQRMRSFIFTNRAHFPADDHICGQGSSRNCSLTLNTLKAKNFLLTFIFTFLPFGRCHYPEQLTDSISEYFNTGSLGHNLK